MNGGSESLAVEFNYNTISLRFNKVTVTIE
jgi:hypothetical protein